MKKFLLFVAAAFVACTAGAQTKAVKNVAKSSYAKTEMKQYKQTMPKMDVVPMTTAKATKYGAAHKVASSKVLTLGELKNISVAKKAVKLSAPRKAGELQASYTGAGQDYLNGGAALSWTMQTGEFEDGTPALIDVIPLPEAWESLENIAVEYEQNGNTLRIEPQLVASNSTYYFFLFSWTSDDFAIELTLGDDGSLTTIEGEDIAYGAFTSDEFPASNFANINNGGTYAGELMDVENVKYYMEGQIPAPTAGYEPEGLFLHPGPTINGSYYTSVLAPAYGEITLKNRTSGGVDAFDWTLFESGDYDEEAGAYENAGDPIRSNAQDFTFTLEPGAYNAATLISSFQGVASDPFTWNPSPWYAAGYADQWVDEGDPTPTFMKANPTGVSLTYLPTDGVSSYILYQGKPASPLFFTGVNLFVYQYAPVSDDVTFICKIYKVSRDANGRLTMGDLIAQSELTDVEEGSWHPRLVWQDFYTEDEGGMTVALDYLLLDEEFALVFEGWDNGTFSGYPLAFTSLNTAGVTSSYLIQSGADEYTGYGYWSFYGNVLAGFIDASYGFLYTEDDTNIHFAAEGGEASIHVTPYFVGVDDDDNLTTDVWVEDEDNFPEWLDFDFANEAYTDEEWGFDLVLSAEALPAGETSRTGVAKFAQRGGLLTLNVTQGASDGISATVVSFQPTGNIYNMAGQRVNEHYKGIVVRNGKKLIQK